MCVGGGGWYFVEVHRYPPKFGEKIQMSCDIFKDIWEEIRLSRQSEECAEDRTSKKYQWRFIDEFVMDFNNHRKSKYSPSN